MISPASATVIILALIGFLLVGVPLLESIPKVGEHISRRYIFVSIAVCLGVGVILNFDKLSDEVRKATVVGSLVLIGIYVTAATLEKLLLAHALGLKRLTFDLHKRKLDILAEPTTAKDNADEDGKQNGEDNGGSEDEDKHAVF